MEAVGEVHDVLAAGRLAGELERRLDRVGAGRAGELHDVVAKPTRREDDLVHGQEEALLGDRVQVEAVGDAVVGDVVDQGLFEHRVVVPVVQRACAGEEVEIALAVHVAQLGAAGVADDGGEAARVGAHVRFQPGESFGLVLRLLGLGLVQHDTLSGPFLSGANRPFP